MKRRKWYACCALLLGLCCVLSACGKSAAEESGSDGISSAFDANIQSQPDASLSASAVASEPENSGIDSSVVASASQISSAASSKVAAGSKTTTAVSSRKPSGTAAPSNGTPEKLLNAAKLTPMRTGCKVLDDKVDEIFKKIHTAGMSTYARVKACYDYLVNNGVYTAGVLLQDPTKGLTYSSDRDSFIIAAAYGILSTNYGVCDNYTSAFVVMTRAIGLESYYVGGQVRKKGGGTTGHAWVNIRLNGTYYVFDPQIQQNNKSLSYHYFCKTDAALGTTYTYENRDADIKAFQNFQHYPSFAAEVTVTYDGVTQSAVCKETDNWTALSGWKSELDLFRLKEGKVGKLTITAAPSGGRGQYNCTIMRGNDLEHMSEYKNEAISGKKTYEIALDPEEQAYRFAVYLKDVSNPSQTACVSFWVCY